MDLALRSGLAVALAAALACSVTASAQPAKGSPEHIKAAVGKVDGRFIRANAATGRDWPSYGLDYAETRHSALGEDQRGQRQGPRPRLVVRPRVDPRRRGDAGGRGRHHVRHGLVEHRARDRRAQRQAPVDVRPEGRPVEGLPRAAATWSTAASRSGRARCSSPPTTAACSALDAATGKQGLGAGHHRRPQEVYTITGAPRVFKGKVIIGNGGAEYGVRGYITAYDAADRRAGLALVHRARRSGQALRGRVDGQGRQDLGPERQVLGGRRRRHDVGHDGLRPRPEPDVRRHRQRLAVGAAARAARRAATTCTSRRSSRSTRTPASTSGTTRRRRATTGTSPRRSR